jgi:hypothetical protein
MNRLSAVTMRVTPEVYQHLSDDQRAQLVAAIDEAEPRLVAEGKKHGRNVRYETVKLAVALRDKMARTFQ